MVRAPARNACARMKAWSSTWPSAAISTSRPKDEDVYDPDLWRGAIMCSDGERAAFEQLCEVGSDGHAANPSSRDRAFSAGGIIACSPFRKIAGCGSMRFSPANRWRSIARQPGSSARCAKAKNRPIMRRSGRSLSCSIKERRFANRRLMKTAIANRRSLKRIGRSTPDIGP